MDASGVRVLYYGCGGGHFLKAGSQIGMAAVGLEVDAEDVAFAQSHALDVRMLDIGFPQNALSANEKFDIVYINHVLEHVSAPSELVGTLLRRLVPGGILVVRTPDQSSVPAKIKIFLHKFGLRNWEYGFVQPPIHLHGYTAMSYRELARIHGLVVKRLQRVSPLDQLEFPTTDAYWASLGAQKRAYQLGRLFASGGHIACILEKT